MKKAQGFESDAEFLDAAATALRSRAVRAAAERELRDAIEAQETYEDERHRGQPLSQLRCRVVALREVEKKEHKILKRRLKAHRRSRRPRLGLDTLSEGRLSDNERVVLLVAVLCSISNSVAEDVLGPLGVVVYSGVHLSDIGQLLGVDRPSGWLTFRMIFQETGPLLRDAHLVFDRPAKSPAEICEASVTVSASTFSIVTGMEAQLDPERV